MRLIDADNASAWLEKYAGICRRGGIHEQAKDLQGFANVLNNPRIFRTVDAVPVVHAYWVNGTYCSSCRAAKARPWAGYLEQNSNTFCHVCGAKMDAKED